ncbi:MAG: IgA Peptidase M64 [Blastocatellia bacterium]|nr:IgA Peptidase M64 [Blastocatellia bacterium]MBN8724562.1 IgA Peptidase M64 [Acidobacteriota bacterium]
MFKLISSIFFLLLSASLFSVFAVPTMRVDYYHTGNIKEELFSLDRVVIEPLPWPGNPQKPIDDTNLGKYFFEVIDRNTNKVIYSRGFASIYGEWETTDEAKSINRTFHESLRFPAPSNSVQVVLKKRDSNNAFQQIWSLLIEPKDIFIDRAKVNPPATLIEILKNGNPENKVDLLILGDGYTSNEQAKFERDARRMTEILFATPPFKERKQDFNVWGLCPASSETGISRPSTGLYRSSPLGCSYDAFGSERYILTYDNRAFRTIASFAPYDFVEILVNNRTYGGGGIFNLYGTVSADSTWAPYIFVHEFGHHFAGLADEYYTSSVAYSSPTAKLEPWEPNVTALLDPDNLKWKHLIDKTTPLPTPWEKEAYEKYSIEYQKKRSRIRQENRPEEEMEALFQENKENDLKTLSKEKYFSKVGAFEGAMYEAKGYYRPEVDCIMFTRSEAFCTVCKIAIERVIDLYK